MENNRGQMNESTAHNNGNCYTNPKNIQYLKYPSSFKSLLSELYFFIYNRMWEFFFKNPSNTSYIGETEKMIKKFHYIFHLLINWN